MWPWPRCSSPTARCSRTSFPRYPEIRADLGLSNAALGTAIAAFPLGALVVGLLAAPLIGRFGSAKVATATGRRLGRRARDRSRCGRQLGGTRGDHVRRRRARRRHRRRDERARPSSPASLWPVDRQLVPRHLEHRSGHRRSHGRRDAGPRRVVGRRAHHGVGALRRCRLGQLPIHAAWPRRRRSWNAGSSLDAKASPRRRSGRSPPSAFSLRAAPSSKTRPRPWGALVPAGRSRNRGRRGGPRVRVVPVGDDHWPAHGRSGRRPLRPTHSGAQWRSPCRSRHGSRVAAPHAVSHADRLCARGPRRRHPRTGGDAHGRRASRAAARGRAHSGERAAASRVPRLSADRRLHGRRDQPSRRPPRRRASPARSSCSSVGCCCSTTPHTRRSAASPGSVRLPR